MRACGDPTSHPMFFAFVVTATMEVVVTRAMDEGLVLTEAFKMMLESILGTLVEATFLGFLLTSFDEMMGGGVGLVVMTREMAMVE